MQDTELRYEMVCLSGMGLVRENNEDNFCFPRVMMPQEHQSLEEPCFARGACGENQIVGVFDGMGGHARGELASFVAAKTLAQIADAHEGDWTEEELVHVLRSLNEAVVRAGEEHRARSTGSTATLLALGCDSFFVANLGDSPAFLFRDGWMCELTKRHTDEELMRSLGVVGARPRLVQYLGVPESEFILEPHVVCESIQDGDVVLLCTDGITDMVDVAGIQAAVEDEADLRSVCARLHDAAMAAGARDNFTMLLCRFSSTM